MISRALAATLLFVFTLGACMASVPPMMSYQGKLADDAGQALPDGTYNMRFYLWSAESGGTALWQEPSVGTRPVLVSGGVFSVVLGSIVPLPSAAFEGNTWLATEVNGTLLSPRMQIVSTGYAMRAMIAESVPDSTITSAKILDGEVKMADLASNSVTSEKVLDGEVKTADLGPNSVTSEKIADGTIQLADLGQNGASANQVIKRNSANTAWTVAADNDTNYWSESSGNIYRSSGNVGIGLTNPNRKLYVVESAEGLSYPLKIDNPHSTIGDATGILFSAGGDGSNNLSTARGKGALVYEYKSTWNRGDFHFLQESSANSDNPTLLNAALTVKNNGNVGIGTTDPGHKLHLSGSGGAMIRMDGEGAGMTGLNLTQSGTTHWSLFVRKWQSDNFIIRDDVAATDTMVFPSGTGKVGVGTATPDAKFHVAGGSGKAVYGKASNASGMLGYGVYGEASYNDGKGVYGLNVTNNNYGYLGASDRGAYGRHNGGNAGSLGGSDYGVRADGDLVVTGAYRGNIGPNNGAPFPRPAYDSGWVSLTPDVGINLYHNLGGNVENYVVDMMFRKSIGGGAYQIHNVGVGHDFFEYDKQYYDGGGSGVHYRYLDTSRLVVERGAVDWHCEQVRVRIWVYN